MRGPRALLTEIRSDAALAKRLFSQAGLERVRSVWRELQSEGGVTVQTCKVEGGPPVIGTVLSLLGDLTTTIVASEIHDEALARAHIERVREQFAWLNATPALFRNLGRLTLLSYLLFSPVALKSYVSHGWSSLGGLRLALGWLLFPFLIHALRFCGRVWIRRRLRSG